MFRRLIDFSNYEILGIATTIFFFLVFIAIIVWALFLRSGYTKEMEQLPLNDGSLPPETNDADKD